MSEQALTGITILDLTSRVAGPYATKLLAMFGARVIKVEPPGRGDISRWFGPFLNDDPDPECSALFTYLNTGKEGITLDITRPAGAELCRRLVAGCDAVVYDFPSEALSSFGLSYASLSQGHPGLVMVSLTPYGQTGPYRRAPWSAITLYAMGGQMAMTGEPDRSPLMPYGYQAEYQLGLNGFAAALTAVYGAQATGQGQEVDVAGMEIQAATLEGNMPRTAYTGMVLKRRGNHASAVSAIYPCKDGYVGLLSTPRNWPQYVAMLGKPDLLRDPRFKTSADRLAHDDELTAIFHEWFLERTRGEIFARAGETNAPVSPVLTVSELFEEPQLKARQFFATVEHPALGVQWYPGPPFRMSETPGEIRPAPLLGQHNPFVFRELLGLDSQELAQLSVKGVV
jgi:crotonobetainyl-CoA:carnitine CoA-transferase CaiB-like acyl-CoA transferase